MSSKNKVKLPREEFIGRRPFKVIKAYSFTGGEEGTEHLIIGRPLMPMPKPLWLFIIANEDKSKYFTAAHSDTKDEVLVQFNDALEFYRSEYEEIDYE